ncbi:MAG: Gfo/Idh/MocA family oxidoreductase [Kiritimatiellae bacterium]|nr:Gfo/Idh/MocA family oxidoreductase [Kiritimatiellia bacterium]
MSTNRRDFIKGTAWMGAAAALTGAGFRRKKACVPGSMTVFADKPIKKLRVGFVGLGMRGPGAVHRIANIPGVEIVALCDLYKNRVEAQQKFLKDNGKAPARSYYVYDTAKGPAKDETAAYRALCESDLDLVYIATPWALHTPVALYAMEHGKHAAIEVPAAMTLDECWALVETSERTGRHCMQLENCCYGDVEMFSLNLARNGILGEIMHAEGAYIHDLRALNYLDPANKGYQGYWRLKWNNEHFGNPYPTHGLVPLMQAMNINRGDRFDYLSCISTRQVGMSLYAKTKYPNDSWRNSLNPKCGDMSTTVMHTVNGKTVMLQHDVTSPRPYSRINLLSGTKGCLNDYPFRIALEEKPGEGAHRWFDEKKTAEIREKYRHPLWKVAGELAKKMGGHGGMDFLMDLRLCYCLQNGLPLDMDVYDLATSCSVCELSERSALNRGNSVDIPDFTRGAWRSNKPLDIVTVDLKKLGLDDVKADDSQLNV